MLDEKTSKEVAGKAGRVLNDPTSTSDEKSVAASALSQASDQAPSARSGAGASPPSQPANSSASSGPPKKLVRFRAKETSPTIEIAEGEYRRLFKAEDQPFEVESDAELQMLRATGHFVEDKEAERAATGEPDKDGSERAKVP